MTAPHITPQDVENNIASTEYLLLPNGRTTLCMLTLKNGFTVTGESSCVSIANYNEATGQKIARENAVDKVWPLMGYALADRLYRTHTQVVHREG